MTNLPFHRFFLIPYRISLAYAMQLLYCYAKSLNQKLKDIKYHVQ
ncbi:hypothetical protein Echvi_2284 [Echinicola vietnamensis DSM 17526]|uniref:Uncharacterized protein n=1 Tax=Echinicola vietnamensis (strain DSM 17526 / LMG 23754 / KMM 6221) TaxID=926556 RepID=L0FZ28_ECHVK|nr:hypothetical protein Echvi_2284 [Echinicola vietnamensis DSM 17526]